MKNISPLIDLNYTSSTGMSILIKDHQKELGTDYNSEFNVSLTHGGKRFIDKYRDPIKSLYNKKFLLV